MVNTNFLTVATRQYKIFILPYIVSVLIHNNNSCVEIITDEKNCINNSQKKYLNKYFNNRYAVRPLLPTDAIPTFANSNITAGAMRWLCRPKIKSKYTYIGDIDIIFLEKDVTKDHIKYCTEINKPYSNIVRRGYKKLTGLHFVKNNPWYSVLTKNEQIKFSRLCSNKPGFDEILLYRIVNKLFSLPHKNVRMYRPVHGIHMSSHRKIIDWNVTNVRINAYKKLMQDVRWKNGEKVFDNGFVYLTKNFTKANQQYNTRKRVQLGGGR